MIVNTLTRRRRRRKQHNLTPASLHNNVPAVPTTESLEDRCLLAAQVITPDVTPITVGPNSTATFNVVYSTENPANARTTGLRLRMHYNSSELTPDITAITNSAFAGATIQDSIDGDTQAERDMGGDDGNTATDRFVNLLWFDIGTNFPAGQTLPLTLFTATFTTSGTFDGETVGFTSDPPVGFDPLNATPAQLNLLTNTNNPPTITSSATSTVPENGVAAIDVDATDADAGDTLTYAISGGPDAALFGIVPL